MAGDEILDTFGCPSPNFVDFDGDGKVDVVEHLVADFVGGLR